MSEPLIEAPALRTQVHDRLRDAILSGEMPPGERISPAEVARRFGVSTMPVRDALQLLEQEGLVETSARRWTRVVQLDSELVTEIVPIVSILEQHAVRTAPVPEHDRVEEMREVNRRFASSIERGDLHGLIDADVELHRLLVAIANNPTLERTLRDVTDRLRLLRARVVRPGLATASVDDHDRVIECLEAGDREGAARAVAANWERGLGRFLDSVDGDAGR